MPIRRSRPLARLGFLVALAIAAAPATGAQAQIFSLKDTVPSITTTGVASVEVAPNVATISLGVETERAAAADAANENARAAQAIIGEIKAQGIDARDINTLAVTLAPVYDETRDANGRVTKRTLRGFAARNDISVRVRQIEKAGALARHWIEKGANYFGGIEFEYDQKEVKYDALRGEAVRDALRKANSYVNGLGIKLGRVLEIAAPGSYPVPTPPALMARAAKTEVAAAIPVEPGVQTLRTEVQVSWELAQ